MISVLHEGDIKIPKCPKNFRDHNYKSETLFLKCEDGSESCEFEILKASVDATRFVLDILYNANFPMMRSDTIKYYRDEYRDDMIKFSENGHCLYESEGDSLYFKSHGNEFVSWNDMDYNESVYAYRNCSGIEQLWYGSSWGYVMYKCFIIWDGDMWRAVSGIEGYLDGSFEDYRWKNIRGTYVMIPDWAESFDDIVSSWK